MKYIYLFLIGLCALLMFLCGKKEGEALKEWPDEVSRVKIESTLDGHLQDALFYVPPEGKKDEPVPLLVALHTWSFDYLQPNFDYYTQCKKRGWIMIHPDFRGPNKNPDACGSPKAVQDVVDAVNYAIKESNVDLNRIYLVGGSGGGHMSLLMAGKHPEIWTAVSAWVPVTDLTMWYHESMERENNKYEEDVKASCGGTPGSTDAVMEEYKNRSPVYFLPRASGIPISISAGIHDGHTGAVPINHSLYAFNVLADANGFEEKVISKELIDIFVNDEAVPEELRNEMVKDPSYPREVLFRRKAGPVCITIFEGGHDILYDAAFEWLKSHKK